MADPLDAAMEGVRRIEAHAEQAGKEVADYLVGRFPPEPSEAVCRDAVIVMVDDMAKAFKEENRPEVFEPQFVAEMQLAAIGGFIARIEALVAAGRGRGGRG